MARSKKGEGRGRPGGVSADGAEVLTCFPNAMVARVEEPRAPESSPSYE